MSNGISKTSKGENMKKYIIILLSCFITTAYADNWVCGYDITITSNYSDREYEDAMENKNITGKTETWGFLEFVNENVKFFTSFVQNGGVTDAWPDTVVQYCTGVTNSYVANCAGAANVPPTRWGDCPSYFRSDHGFVCEKCPSLDDVAGTNGENVSTVAAVLNGGIGCLNYDNPDIKKLVDGTVDTLFIETTRSITSARPSYLTYDPIARNLGLEYMRHNGWRYNSITINKKATAYKFNTIDECYIPKDNEIHDVSGTYVFTENCHWKR